MSEETEIKHELSVEMINKLIQMVNELMINNNDLHKHISSLRYTLEMLIITNLLIKEKDYFAKVYFGVYKQQENKTNQLILRLKYELKLLKEYSEKYNKEIEEIKSDKEREKIFQVYKQQAQSNINLLFSQLEEYGFEYSIASIEKTILPEHEAKLEKEKASTFKEAKHLAKEKWFQEYFGFRLQPSNVFKQLTDTRPWNKKAEDANLKQEYQLNYEITSSLLHFTSYSLRTSNVISDREKEYNYLFLNQYIEQITTKLSAFSGVMRFDLFKVIKV